MKKFLVTGGAGFIGSHIVDKLLEQGNEVVVVDNFSTGGNNVNPKAESMNIDISERRNRLDLCKAMEGVDTVFHCAALARVQPSIEEPQRYHKVNVDGTLNVLMSAKESGVRRVVYSASSSAYGDQSKMPLVETMPTAPISPYGLQKLIGEQYCFVFSKCYGLETVSLRYFNIYGERQVAGGAYSTAIGTFLKQIYLPKNNQYKCSLCVSNHHLIDLLHILVPTNINVQNNIEFINCNNYYITTNLEPRSLKLFDD